MAAHELIGSSGRVVWTDTQATTDFEKRFHSISSFFEHPSSIPSSRKGVLDERHKCPIPNGASDLDVAVEPPACEVTQNKDRQLRSGMIAHPCE
ncbi:hypothetical protein CH63R_04446 [Colletotrichum higginsianum IMI 349063]|uniref:Uncharacterized protein n=1 Tax=Colletotrichum higginsianum (strain IMI 349063) TaxID=759273 RepID=A0A1B7YJF2_COLHI|nr:hypothetical protein CH63R_04446 [Colletotrichum higginsianum IMI 349063]OBR12150.1 hypothetical protein CH63R_04446 [Colletotrichum higginsianum IMI 349063]